MTRTIDNDFVSTSCSDEVHKFEPDKRGIYRRTERGIERFQILVYNGIITPE